MFGRKQRKRKYKRHLSIRIAVGILLILLFIQLITLGVNAFGLFASTLIGDASTILRIGSFIEENIDGEALMETSLLKERTPAFDREDQMIRGYVFAANRLISRLLLFSGDDENGYYVLTDIASGMEKTYSFGEKLDGIRPGLVDELFIEHGDESAAEEGDESITENGDGSTAEDGDSSAAEHGDGSGAENGQGSAAENGEKDTGNVERIKMDLVQAATEQKARKELASAVIGSTDVKELMLCGVINGTESSKVRFLLVLDPFGIIETSLISIMILAVVTVVSTLVLLLILVFWINRRVASPLVKINRAAAGFIEQTQKTPEPGEWSYQAPVIRTKDEIQELGDTVKGMALEIKKSIQEILTAAKEKERQGVELDLAARIQQSMLPSTFPAFPDRSDFDIYASMNPAREVGGDFYDFFLVDDTHLFVTIADVSGKGIPASLFMMSSKLIISSLAKESFSPAEILSRANNQIAGMNEENMFVTAWIGILDLTTGCMRAANAGHEYPAVRSGDNGFSLLKDKHGFVLGELENMKYHEYEILLQPGDAVFVYTDGVCEANDEQSQMLGPERMLAALNRVPGRSPEEALKAVAEEISRFTGDTPQFDDVTMLSVTYLGNQSKEGDET